MANKIWDYLATLPDKRVAFALDKVFRRLFTDTGDANGANLLIGGGAVTSSYTELNLLDGATFTTAEANASLADSPYSVTGTTATSATSASSQLIFLNAAGTTAIGHRFKGRAHISTTASGSTFGVVSAISAATNGTIGEITSGAFDFITTVSGRLGLNIINGTSTNYVTFTFPNGKIAVSAPFVTS